MIAIKEQFVGYLISFIIAVFVNTYQAITIIGALIFVDFLCGIISEYKTKGWGVLSSRTAFIGIMTKGIIYGSLVIITGMLQNVYNVPAVNWLLFVILFVELKSIDEHIEKIWKFSILKLLMELVLDGKKNFLAKNIKQVNESKNESK